MSTTNPYESPRVTDTARPAPSRGGEVAFRTRFWPLYAVATPATALVITITGHGMGLPIDFPLTLGLSSIACIPLTWFLTLFFKVYASEQGIRCFDFWGRYHRTPWSAITGERPINLLGLRYLRIDAQDRVTIWLPLYLHRQSAFWEFAGTWWSPGDGDPKQDNQSGLHRRRPL